MQQNSEADYEIGECSYTDARSLGNGDRSVSPKAGTSKLATTQEHENEHEEHDQYDDETASKGSKESFNEKVINTNYTDNDNDKDAADQSTKNQMLRRKSLAPSVHHE